MRYLVGVFEQFWLHATPWEEQLSYAPELDGIPSVRTVLLKGLDDHGLSFFTNLRSRKGQELSVNARIRRRAPVSRSRRREEASDCRS